MILIKLFISFFKSGMFAVGGAYSFLPLIEREVVQKYGWLTKDEFMDVLGMVGIFPGAISIKYATYVGYKMAGVLGVLAANFGNFIPPVLLILGASLLYNQYKEIPAVKGAFNMVRIAVFAMIIAVAFKLVGIKYLVSLKALIFAALFFIAFFLGKIHPVFIILGAGVLGVLIR